MTVRELYHMGIMENRLGEVAERMEKMKEVYTAKMEELINALNVMSDRLRRISDKIR